MFTLRIHENAGSDLEALFDGAEGDKGIKAAGRIVALLEEIENNPALLDSLTDHGYGANRDESYHVSKWQKHWRQGRDLWRLKAWDLETKGIQYRVPYAYLPGRQEYHVLGVICRQKLDYDDDDNPITRRILDSYEDL